MDGQLAHHFVAVVARRDGTGGTECDLRVLLDIQEIGALEVSVALPFTSIDAGRVEIIMCRTLKCAPVCWGSIW
jgi:hypothetical protein